MYTERARRLIGPPGHSGELVASAIAATFACRRANNAVSHGRCLLPLACLGNASSVFLTAELTNEGVEGGREQKAEAGHAQHPEQHGCAQRLPHFRACSGRNGEWGNAKNE